MKKIFHLSVIVVALSVLGSVGILWAGPVAPVCPVHSQQCFERDADFYCSWTEERVSNKLVRGRAGQLEYRRVPTSLVRTEKCTAVVHENLK